MYSIVKWKKVIVNDNCVYNRGQTISMNVTSTRAKHMTVHMTGSAGWYVYKTIQVSNIQSSVCIFFPVQLFSYIDQNTALWLVHANIYIYFFLLLKRWHTNVDGIIHTSFMLKHMLHCTCYSWSWSNLRIDKKKKKDYEKILQHIILSIQWGKKVLT